jgi:predicted phage-related endonuclease
MNMNMNMDLLANKSMERRLYVGGSDARTVMGHDEGALIRLWREKRGEIEPEDLSRNLTVQFGIVTEELNRRWFERETGRQLAHIQTFLRHPKLEWMGADA